MDEHTKAQVKVFGFVFFLLALITFTSFALASRGGAPGKVPTACNDHIDNDGDGYCDFSWRKAYCSDGSIIGDADCSGKDDTLEGCVIACRSSSDCGIDGFVGSRYCGGDRNVYQDYRSFICNNAGSCGSSCSSQTTARFITNCSQGCLNGECAIQNTSVIVKVAFIGDQGINANAKAVLQLIKNEGADVVLHQGDLGYGTETNVQTAIDWDRQITDILGANFPYFASKGNHDQGNWGVAGGYQDLLEARASRVGVNCTGNYGENSACKYRGLFFVLSAGGESGTATGNAAYISNELSADNSVWSVCSWHRNRREMQIGGKTSEVGWELYEACRQQGAIIATAHEHSYERTKTLINITNLVVDTNQHPLVGGIPSNPNHVLVGAGKSFVFVSGLGGNSIRDQERCLPSSYPYGGGSGCNYIWASISTTNQSADYGALFCSFPINGDQASCYFKDIRGRVPDQFNVTRV